VRHETGGCGLLFYLRGGRSAMTTTATTTIRMPSSMNMASLLAFDFHVVTPETVSIQILRACYHGRFQFNVSLFSLAPCTASLASGITIPYNHPMCSFVNSCRVN
jgi:hypothetical protein